jgi:hypothetical protein
LNFETIVPTAKIEPRLISNGRYGVTILNQNDGFSKSARNAETASFRPSNVAGTATVERCLGQGQPFAMAA